MSTLVAPPQEPVVTQDKTPQDQPRQLRGDNPSFVLHGVDNVKYENRPIPEPQNDQVLIEIAATGICGSDVHYLKHGSIGHFVVKEPMCLGHESSGTIVKLGPAAGNSGLTVGQRVALEPGVSCRACGLCKSGQYEMSFAATPPIIYGTLARYYVLPADLLHPLPPSVSFEDGAMMEPLSVGVHSVANLGNCRSDSVVIVFGAGPVGLLCMAVAKALGARRVIAVDIQQERLDFAKSYVASDVFLPEMRGKDEEPGAYCQRMAASILSTLNIPSLGPGGVDLSIEASGAPSCVAMGIHVLKPSGTYVQVGMGANMTVPVPLFDVITKQLNVTGSFRYGAGDYPLAISLVERGLIDLKPLVTQRYPFKDALAAFEMTRKGKDDSGKSSSALYRRLLEQATSISLPSHPYKSHLVERKMHGFAEILRLDRGLNLLGNSTGGIASEHECRIGRLGQLSGFEGREGLGEGCSY